MTTEHHIDKETKTGETLKIEEKPFLFENETI